MIQDKRRIKKVKTSLRKSTARKSKDNRDRIRETNELKKFEP